MRTCDECGVGFSGDLELCPLCGSHLVGDPTPPVFPVQEVRKPARAAQRALGAITVLAIVAVAAMALAWGLRPWPAALACVAVALNYLFLRNVLAHSPDFLRIAERYFLVLLAGSALWWLAAGSHEVASFVVPAICLAGTLTNTVLVIAYRDRFVQGYAKYLLYSLVLGVAPLGLVALGAAAWPWLCYASAFAAVMLSAMLLLLTRRQLSAELRKLFAT